MSSRIACHPRRAASSAWAALTRAESSVAASDRGQRIHPVDVFRRDPQRGPARRQHGQVRHLGQERADLPGVLDEALESVQHQQHRRATGAPAPSCSPNSAGRVATNPSAVAASGTSTSTSSTPSRSTRTAPPGKRSATARAASMARRVLPTPPGPTSVTSRTPGRTSSSHTSLSSPLRPIVSVAGAGSLTESKLRGGSASSRGPGRGSCARACGAPGPARAELAHHAVAAGAHRLERFRLASVRYKATIRWARSRSRSGCSPTRVCSSPTRSASRPPRELGGQAFLDRFETQLFESGDFPVGEVVELMLRQHVTAPQCQRLVQIGGCAFGVVATERDPRSLEETPRSAVRRSPTGRSPAHSRAPDDAAGFVPRTADAGGRRASAGPAARQLSYASPHRISDNTSAETGLGAPEHERHEQPPLLESVEPNGRAPPTVDL